jgi:hypothetical protein
MGEEDYSSVRTVYFDRDLFQVEVYPNPSEDYLEVKVLTKGERYDLKLYDELGSQVIIRRQQMIPMQRLDLDGLSAGEYNLVVESGDNKTIRKIIVVKD